MPRSFLLQNDGTGKFTDVTAKYSIDLLQPGMVTCAQWFDIDKDGDKDLLLCFEWGGIDAYINNKTGLVRKVISDKKGWWNFLLPFDVDNDGNIDIIAGNFGLNSRLKASEEAPVTLYYNDFDDNGKKEQILTYYVNGQEIPFATKQELEKQLPFLKKKFLYAEDFAKSSLTSLFSADKIDRADKLTVNFFSNAILMNKGDLQFETIALPFEAQLSSLKDAVIVNANNDTLPDLLMTGNYYDNSVELGRQDADFGTILINKGNGKFVPEPLNGITIQGQVRHIKPIEIKNQNAFILSRNNDSTIIIKFK